MCFCFGALADKISGVVYNDLTGNFLFMSIDGSVCFFVLYHYKTNAILVKPISNVDDHSIFTDMEVFKTLEAKGYKPNMNMMDNRRQSISKKFSPQRNVIYSLWSHTITVSTRQSVQSIHCDPGNH